MVTMGPMLMLEWVLVLLLAAVVLANLAERLAVHYPSLLATASRSAKLVRTTAASSNTRTHSSISMGPMITMLASCRDQPIIPAVRSHPLRIGARAKEIDYPDHNEPDKPARSIIRPHAELPPPRR